MGQSNETMCRELLKLSAFLLLTDLFAPADNGRLCRNFIQKSTMQFLQRKSPFFVHFAQLPELGRPLYPDPICFYSHCRPSAAAQAGIRRSVLIWKIFLLEAGRRSVRIFSRIASFTRSGRICLPQNLKAAAHFNRLLVFYLPAQ